MSAARVTEGRASVRVFTERIVSKEMPVFYNPVMAINRDISVALLASLGRKGLRVADPLCASGIRAARFSKELPRGMIASIALNDGNPEAIKLARANMRANASAGIDISFSAGEGSKALLDGGMLDYIDIDPFGSPNPFLDAAAKRIGRKGIIAITATDTAALCGTAPPACRRKYWAEPLHGALMNEAAVRILVRKSQLVGAQYEKALMPIFCHATGHYIRIYMQHQGGRSAVDSIIKRHAHLHWCPSCMTQKYSKNAEENCCGRMRSGGPLWSGQLWDEALARRMGDAGEKLSLAQESRKLLGIIGKEATVQGLLHVIPAFGRALHASIPPTQSILEGLRRQGYSAELSHLAEAGIRSDADAENVSRLIRPRGARR